MKSQKEQYEKMFRTDPSIVPDLYFETRLAGLALPSESGTWAVLLQRAAGLGGFRKDVDLREDLANLVPPTLILWGEKDMLPAEEGERASRSIPRRRFVSLPGVGHFPFLEATEECRRLILEFARQQS